MSIFKQISSDALSDMEIVCVLDGFEPQLAPIVIEVISEQSEDMLHVMTELACGEAWRSAERGAELSACLLADARTPAISLVGS